MLRSIAACNLPINSLDTFSTKDIYLQSNLVYTLVIDYPVKDPIKVDINAGKKGMGFLEILNEIRKIYMKIYFNPEKYGIKDFPKDWLTLRKIYIDHLNRVIELDIGKTNG